MKGLLPLQLFSHGGQIQIHHFCNEVSYLISIILVQLLVYHGTPSPLYSPDYLLVVRHCGRKRASLRQYPNVPLLTTLTGLDSKSVSQYNLQKGSLYTQNSLTISPISKCNAHGSPLCKLSLANSWKEASIMAGPVLNNSTILDSGASFSIWEANQKVE